MPSRRNLPDDKNHLPELPLRQLPDMRPEDLLRSFLPRPFQLPGSSSSELRRRILSPRIHTVFQVTGRFKDHLNITVLAMSAGLLLIFALNLKFFLKVSRNANFGLLSSISTL